MVTEQHLFKDAVILRTQGQHRCIAVIFWQVGDALPISYEADNLNGDFETAAKNTNVLQVHVQGTKGEMLAYECIEISNCMITQTYT